MGVGKTAVCQELKKRLPNSVFLDGDWCWDAHPFQVNEETKSMVQRNICFLLSSFIRCSCYENIVFCWVLHDKSIIDAILESIPAADCDVKTVSLLCREDTLRARLEKDVKNGVRTRDVIERSVERLPLYDKLDTIKLGTDGKSAADTAGEIMRL